MKRFMHPVLPAAVLLASLVPSVRADPRVAVVAEARPDYTEQKYAGGKPRAESYVFMEGHYFEGGTVDHSIERTPFRRIAEYLAPELARQQYFPTTEIGKADLLIRVHWGTTMPRVTVQEMFNQTSMTADVTGAADIHGQAMAYPDGDMGFLPPAPDTNRAPEANDINEVASRLVGTMTEGNSATLLGYNSSLYRLNKKAWGSAAANTLLFDMAQERYFIILEAYDLAATRQVGASRRPLWTMHLNISSPGNNFQTALSQMSTAAVEFVGRTTLEVTTVRPGERTGTVHLAPLVILGERK